MSPSAIPERFSAVTPSLVVTPCADAIDFYREAFGAEEVEQRMTGPDGMVGHAEISIEGCVIMLADEWPDGPTKSPQTLGGSTGALFIYTDDVDAMWDRAIAAGATEVFPLEVQFYGDKSGRLEDPFGHTWGVGQHVEDVSAEEMERRMASFYEDLPD
jgi:PhnB protein